MMAVGWRFEREKHGWDPPSSRDWALMDPTMRASRISRWTCAAVIGIGIGIGGGARANEARAAEEPNESVTAAAESLFQDGRKLTLEGRYDEACPKFLASHKIAPAHGTLLNLADCYENNGQLASAWARFHEAIALAQRLGRPDREKIARDRAERLAPRLIKLTIAVPRDADVEVKLDGLPLDAAARGTPIPVDRGKHTLEATARGKKRFIATIEVSEADPSPTVAIPALEDDAPPPTPRDAAPARPAEDVGGGSPQKTIAVVLAAVGVAGVGTGAFFGLRASSRWSDAKSHCDERLECDATGVALADEARTSGNVSTISFIAGGALVALGAVLFFTAPKNAGGMHVGIGPGSLLLGGAF
jgi:tetratricopeptide (TPR) repeat protein